jgi:hypothetical protein
MTKLQKIDFVIKCLYQNTRKNGQIRIISDCATENLNLTFEEMREIKNILEMSGYALFKIDEDREDFLGQITPKGVEFAETSSISKRGVSVLELSFF